MKTIGIAIQEISRFNKATKMERIRFQNSCNRTFNTLHFIKIPKSTSKKFLQSKIQEDIIIYIFENF